MIKLAKEHMNVNDFTVVVSTQEGGKVNLTIAQIKEVVSITRNLIKQYTGIDIYCLIRLIKK